jgi:NarL family two-component system sensor histidine kinase LiaS
MSQSTSFSKGYQQLRWKLTLSYAGVTVGALLTVELILLGLAAVLLSILINSGFLPAQLIEATTESYSPVLRSFLQQAPPDQAGIGEWLDRVGAVTSITLPLSFDVNEEMLVVGSDGTLLGAFPPGSSLIGRPIDHQAIPGLTDPLLAALAGEEDSQRLYTLVRPENEAVLAIPVWDASNEEVLGVLVARGEIPTLRTYLGDLTWIIGISLLLFTVVAGLIGTAYGYLAARGPVRRLNRLSEATGAWSEGDFSNVVDDPAQDELGYLAQRLNQMARQLEQLLDTRRELAVVEERNRLARDLHDSAKQQAFAAAAQVSAARALLKPDPEAAESHIEEAERLIDDLRLELTSLIQELRPAALENKGLARAVRDYTADWSRQNGITAEVIVRGERSLPLDREQTLYRIMQEALANVARHSEAAKVEISLLYSKKEISLTVTDDGHGYGTDDKSRGFGLSSMQDRAQGAGGKLTVESVLEKGTTVSCILPAGEGAENDPEEAYG